jgi:DNA-binding MarR family transcriptional regulator
MPDEIQDYTQRVWAVLPTLMRTIAAELRQLEPRLDLTMWQIMALKWLKGDALTVGELARKYMVSNPTMTRLLDNLVERGLVERREDPDDRRRVRLLLTERGEDLYRELERRALHCVEEIMVGLDSAEKERVAEAMDILQIALQRRYNLEQRSVTHG